MMMVRIAQHHRGEPTTRWIGIQYDGGPESAHHHFAHRRIGLNLGEQVSAMTLEHYPGMTEKALADIEAEANERWPLEASLIVHRYGRMLPGEDIVLVITCSSHREAAFEACQFLMDWLKTKAPFWKLEEGGKAAPAKWIDARESDNKAGGRWSKPDK